MYIDQNLIHLAKVDIYCLHYVWQNQKVEFLSLLQSIYSEKLNESNRPTHSIVSALIEAGFLFKDSKQINILLTKTGQQLIPSICSMINPQDIPSSVVLDRSQGYKIVEITNNNAPCQLLAPKITSPTEDKTGTLIDLSNEIISDVTQPSLSQPNSDTEATKADIESLIFAQNASIKDLTAIAQNFFTELTNSKTEIKKLMDENKNLKNEIQFLQSQLKSLQSQLKKKKQPSQPINIDDDDEKMLPAIANSRFSFVKK